MKHLVLIAFLLQGTLGCFPTRQAQYQYGAPTAQFQAPVGAPAQAAGQPVVSAARVAAAGKSATGVIRPEGSAADSLFGSQVALEPFTADGYNKEAGGPVNSGPALTCNFDGKPCCWANVPSPEDQLDWQIATGAPNNTLFRDAPAMQGSYLVAYARGAAPSDEAQFTSCSIGCSSSPITVRAKHWQSNQVLLQVCLRDSFPNNVEHNPLLHCQELPPGKGLTTTEVVLPKTSLVDIIFVASDFTSEQGDIAILDDIEVSYDNAGPECQSQDEDELQRETANSASHKQIIESSNHQEATLPDKDIEIEGFEKPFGGNGGESHGRGHGFRGKESGVEEETAAGGRGRGQGFGGKSGPETGSEGVEESESGLGGQEGPDSEVKLVSGKDRFGESGFRGGATAFGKKGSAEAGSGSGIGVNQAQIPNEETLIQSIKTGKKTGPVVKGAKTKKFSETICQSTKCDFENGNTCSYKDAYQEQSIRGITTKFEVTEGQYKNRVTGVKESSEGDFYAATFLYPREKAGLEAVTEAFSEKSRMRFRYYEGTHGVQLKGCCGTIENCPFSSDKFVSVSDRTWKTASFKCPKGTDRVIFLCENTRTNQGACAVDDIGMVESDGSLKTVRPLC